MLLYFLMSSSNKFFSASSNRSYPADPIDQLDQIDQIDQIYQIEHV